MAAVFCFRFFFFFNGHKFIGSLPFKEWSHCLFTSNVGGLVAVGLTEWWQWCCGTSKVWSCEATLLPLLLGRLPSNTPSWSPATLLWETQAPWSGDVKVYPSAAIAKPSPWVILAQEPGRWVMRAKVIPASKHAATSSHLSFPSWDVRQIEQRQSLLCPVGSHELHKMVVV